MVALLADDLGERAADVAGFAEARHHGPKVPLRPPAELAPGERVVVDPVDAPRHPPAPPRIFVLPAGDALAHDRRRIGAKARRILAAERRRCADDVSPEPDRRRALGRDEMGRDHVLDGDAAEQEFVRLQIGVGEGRARLRVVVLLGEKARGSQNHARESLIARKQPAEVLGGGLRDAIDVLRNRRYALVDPGRRLARRGVQRVAECARRAGHHEGPHAGARRLLEQYERPEHVGLDEFLKPVRADMRLVQGRSVQDRVDPVHAARDKGPVGDRPDNVGERTRNDIETDDVAPCAAQGPHQRFAEMPRTSGDENGHGRSALKATPSHYQALDRVAEMALSRLS